MMTKRGIQIMRSKESQKEVTSDPESQKPKSRVIKWGAKPPTISRKIITLISAEGDRFDIDEGSLSYLDAIQAFRTGPFQEKTATEIYFKEIPSSLLKEIATILKTAWANRNLKGFELLKVIDKKAQIKDPMALLQAADFLDSKVLKKVVAYIIAKPIIAKQKNLPEYYKTRYYNPDLYRSIIAEVVLLYYFAQLPSILNKFNTNRNIHADIEQSEMFDIPTVDLKDIIEEVESNREFFSWNISNLEQYHISIQDYLDYAPQFIQARIKKGSAYLYRLSLTSIEGLITFPNAAEITALDLGHNRLINIPAKSFSSFKNLESLYLQKNSIAFINSEMLHGLSHLRKISLSRNPFTEIPNNMFHYTPLLHSIELEGNSLKSFNPEVIQNLPHLKKVWLAGYERWLNAEFKANLRRQFPAIEFDFENYCSWR